MNDSKVSFHEEAEREMLAAAEFYESQEPGLEQQFFDEIDHGLPEMAMHLSLKMEQQEGFFGNVHRKMWCIKSIEIALYSTGHLSRWCNTRSISTASGNAR